MVINKIYNETELTVELEGRLDTNTSPELEADLKQSLDGVTALVFDFGKLEYISSAGLRAMVAAQKLMKGRGPMKLRNVSDLIMEIFEVTGFTDILSIEE